MNHSLAFFALPFLLASLCVAADTAEFYIGTHTKPGGSRGIYRGALDLKTGALSAPVLVGEAQKPGFLAIRPDGKFLYAVMENNGGAVGAFAIEKNGSLRRLNVESTKGPGATHLTVHPGGKSVLAANYVGGSIAALPIREDGSLGPASAFVQHTGSSVDSSRQQEPHAHGIYVNGDFAYVCDLGTDDVFVYRFDAAKGTLTPNVPRSGKVLPGSGPRHFAFHPKGGFAYANNEMACTVTSFAHDAKKGTLAAIQTITTLPEGYAITAKDSTAEIFCHPTGRFLYVSNRGHDTIAVFSIGDGGYLTPVQHAPANVKVPRGFALSPDGGWLVAAGQNDDSLASHRIDPATGRLTPAAQVTGVGSPICVVFAVPR
jgi:6-phosphogluconolactonase